jgi:hypothetical protein
MKLLIAIPALNEEESIDSIIRRSIEAREFICASLPITDVSITIVCDGSTDSTSSHKTKGMAPPSRRLGGSPTRIYWGTSMSTEPASRSSSVRYARPRWLKARMWFLGCRLNTNSQMPLIRDLRRSSLDGLYPLPDGVALHS